MSDGRRPYAGQQQQRTVAPGDRRPCAERQESMLRVARAAATVGSCKSQQTLHDDRRLQDTLLRAAAAAAASSRSSKHWAVVPSAVAGPGASSGKSCWVGRQEPVGRRCCWAPGDTAPSGRSRCAGRQEPPLQTVGAVAVVAAGDAVAGGNPRARHVQERALRVAGAVAACGAWSPCKSSCVGGEHGAPGGRRRYIVWQKQPRWRAAERQETRSTHSAGTPLG